MLPSPFWRPFLDKLLRYGRTRHSRKTRPTRFHPRLELLEDRTVPSVTAIPIPTPNTLAHGIALGSDGNMWFTEPNVNQIGMVNASTQVVTEYPIPSVDSNPLIITAGPNGNLWFTEYNLNQIGEINPTTGAVTEFPIPTPQSFPHGIIAGPDGNVWFTESGANKIGEINPTTGAVTEYPVPTANSTPYNITAGADGNLWFTEIGANQIGEINPSTGAVTEFPVAAPSANLSVDAIAAGSDGNLWFTEVTGDEIGEINAATGAVTQHQLFLTNCRPEDIAAGPGGELWFTEALSDRIGEIDPATGAIREFVATGGGEDGIAAGPGGTLWYTAVQANQIDEFAAISDNAPTVTGISPAAGPLSGDTVVTITGTNLAGASAYFGYSGNNGASVLSESDTQIVVDDPASPTGTAGMVPVAVWDTNGIWVSSPSNGFTYVTAPPDIVISTPTSVSILAPANHKAVIGINASGFFTITDPSGIVLGPGSDGTISANGSTFTSADLAAGQSFSIAVGSAGVVQLGAANVIPPTTDVTVSVGGTLDLDGFADSIDALDGAGAITNSQSTSSVLTVGSNNSGGSFSGALTGDISLVKAGTAVEMLSGTNSYTGGTTISAGTLNINSDSALGAAAGVVDLYGGTLQFAAAGGITLNSLRSIVLGGGAFDTNSANDTIAGVISGSSTTNSNFIKNGAGDLALTNMNTYAGSTIVNAGGLVVGSSGSLGSGPLAVNNTSPASSSTELYLFNTAGQTVGTLSGVISQAANGNTEGIFLGSGVILTANQTAPTTFPGTISGSGGLTLSGSSTNTLTLTGNSTYTGSTTINGGAIQLGATGGLDLTNVLPAMTTLMLDSGGTLNLNNNDQTVGDLASSSGNINTGTGTGGILTIGNTAGGTVTYSGVISGTGGLTWGIVNTNVANPTPTTLILTSTATNTGPMTINTGTLSIMTPYALSGGVAPVLPYNSSNTYPGPFTLGPTATLLTNGFNLTVGSLGGGGPIGGNINLGNNSSSSLYIVQSASAGYAGVISGTGNVYIVNGSSLAIYGNWTLTGGVIHDVTTLTGNNTDSPQSYLPFATSGLAVATQGINLAGLTDQVSTIYGGSANDNNNVGTFVDSGSGGTLVLSYYADAVANGGPANGLGGMQTFSGYLADDVGLIVDAGYWGNAQQLTLSGPNNTTGPLTIGFTDQTTPQDGAATGSQSGVTNQVIISGASTFGAVTVGNIVESNIVDSLTMSAGTLNATSVTVDAGATLGGSGTIVAPVTVNGDLTPGGAAQLTTGALTFGATGSLNVDLDGTAPGTGYDQVIVNSPAGVNLAASPTLNVTLRYAQSDGDTYTIVKNADGGGVIGTFRGLPQGATLMVGSQAFTISYVGGVSGHDIVLTALAAPPALAGLPVVNATNAVINIVSATGNGTTATLTTSTPHGFWVGELVTLTGTTPGGPGGLAGTVTVTGVPSATTFQIASTYDGSETLSGATVTAALAGAQRSMVDSIVFNFSEPVNLTAAAFSISVVVDNTSTGNEVGVAPTLNVAAVPFTNEWVVTFTDPTNNSVIGHSIANGAYNISINPALVTAVSDGQNLSAGETDTFYRLYGDVTGVQSVKNVDANAFNRAWGNFYYSFNFNAALDFNDDGKYTNIDANAFNRAFNTRFQLVPTI